MTTDATLVVEIFTDGACSGNPGPGGWGALLRYGSKERELFGGEPDTTNNRMELTAVIEALDALTRSVRVHVHTDSTYVQQGITRWIHGWKKNGWKTKAREPVKNADLWQRLELAATRHQVHWHWVKGHAGHEGFGGGQEVIQSRRSAGSTLRCGEEGRRGGQRATVGR